MLRIATVVPAALIAAGAGIGLGAGTASAAVVQSGSTNGYSVSADNATTSCGFALAVARKVPASFTGQSISVFATSPATGKSYEVACTREYQKTIKCTTYSTGVLIYLNP